jgi:perosamine synthetase
MAVFKVEGSDMTDEDFQKRVESVLESLKFGANDGIPVYDKSVEIGRLKPLRSNAVADNTENIRLLAGWREIHFDAYPTQFTVTEEGTRKWLEEQVVGKKDRILFMLYASDGNAVGHMGLANFNFHHRFCEADNIVRGSESHKGAMTAAFNAMLDWAFRTFGLASINLRVFSDNIHAISFYKRCGFDEVRKIPLERVRSGDSVKFVEVPPGVQTVPDRYFSLMNLQNPDAKKPGSKMILTAGPSITHKEVDYVLDAVKNGWNLSWNKYIRAFEEKFAEYTGVRYALSTSSGTGALHLALLAMGIQRGDEVIVPDLSWIATASAVCYCGATPVFADIDKDTWCINPGSIENAITGRTKAIMPVHLYGHPSDMEAITKIAEANDLFVLEDAAPSIGSTLHGRPTGSFGDMAVFSFQGAKLLVTGEGGMLVTDDEKLYERAKFLNDHGRDPNVTFMIKELGYKYKMSNLQAALGLAQLERVEELVSKKRRIFEWYYKRLGGADGLVFAKEKPWVKSNQWMTSFVLGKKFPVTRNELISRLKESGIDSRPFFYTMSKFPMFKDANNAVAQFASENGINLPSGVNMTEEEVDYVAETVRSILGA